MDRLAGFLAGATAMAATATFANSGSIPFVAGTSVYRPNQRAVVAFDGHEQILLLSTDLRANKPTQLLEVLPFPSKPKVTPGDGELFQKAAQLIEDRLAAQQNARRGIRSGSRKRNAGNDVPGLPPAAEVPFHERIGAQDISVVRVLDSRHFIAWTEDYLRNAGVESPSIPMRLKLLVREYLRDGFTWFVFNVIELGPDEVAKETLQYRFDTRNFYYPLRILSGESSDATIRIILVSPRLVRMPDIHPARARLMHQPVAIDPDELKYLGGGLADFLGSQRQQLRLWEIKGPMNRLRRDVLTGWFP